MSDNNPDIEAKNLHDNSDYPLHHPNKGTVKPSAATESFIKKWWKKIFG